MDGLRQPLTAAVAAAGLLTCGMFGCGSSGTDNTAADSLTKAQFLKAGNQICQERLEEKDEILKDAVETIPSSEAAEPSRSTLTQLGESIIPPVRKMSNELSELSGPPSSEAAAEKMVSELEAGLEKAEADPSRLIQTNPFTKAGKSAKASGFQACAL